MSAAAKNTTIVGTGSETSAGRGWLGLRSASAISTPVWRSCFHGTLRDGRWVNRSAYNGKTTVDIDKQGRPSKWVTLRACTVLKAAYSNHEEDS